MKRASGRDERVVWGGEEGAARPGAGVPPAIWFERHYGNTLPANLYGPADNLDLHSSHVIPAIVRKCLEAKAPGVPSLTVWGMGKPSREFLYVNDAARGIMPASERYDKPEPVNLGTAHEVSIRQLVDTIVRFTGYQGHVRCDSRQPDGQPRRELHMDKETREFEFRADVDLEEAAAYDRLVH